MKFSTCALLTAVLLAQTRTAEAKAYKGAEVYSLQSVLYGRMEMRMRMIRGSGLAVDVLHVQERLGDDRHGLGRDGHRGPRQERREDLAVEPHHREPEDDVRAGVHGDELARRRLSHVHARMDAGLRLVVVRRHDGQEDRRRPGEQPDQPRDAFASTPGRATARAGPARSTKRRCPRTSSSTGSSTTGMTTASSCSTGRTTSTASIPTRWATGNWTFDGNLVGLRSRERGRSGRHADPRDHERRRDGIQRHGSRRRRQHQRWRRHHLEAGFRLRLRDRRSAAAWHRRPLRDAGRARPRRGPPPAAPVPSLRCHRSRVSKPRLTLAALLLGMLAPSAASAVQSAELYRTAGLLLRPLRSARPIRSRRRGRQLLLSLEGWLVVDDVLERARLREDQLRLPPADQHLDGQGNAERADQHPHVQHLHRLPHVRVRMDAGLHRLVHRRHADPEGDGRQRHRVHAERVPGHVDPLQHLGKETRASEEPSTLRRCPFTNT